MRSELVEKKPIEATVKVTVPANDVDAEFENVVSGLARTVRIPGFRPGKAPRGVLEKRIGKESLAGEVQDKIIDSHYQAAMTEHELLPISVHFHAHAPERGSDYSFEIHAELYPEVELPDLGVLTIDAPSQTLDDETFAAAIEQLRRENATLVPVDRPVQADDWLLIETVPANADTAREAATTEADTA
ncbi:MAG TPA: trigger factor, partial [Trueperaceae bacterium]|nr:trigger factor [Trueperaceae bacterium]